MAWRGVPAFRGWYARAMHLGINSREVRTMADNVVGTYHMSPCKAHLAARRVYWADMMGDSPKVKRRVEYDDMSELHNGHTVKHCQCPGNRVPARGEIPGGFHPWGSDPLSELGYVCDDCGVMCGCCANCQTVGDCECVACDGCGEYAAPDTRAGCVCESVPCST